MGTKNKPGTFDCYNAAAPDEPMFVLLARDPIAADMVATWADMREEDRGPSAKVDEARACAESMRAWHAEHVRVQGPCWICTKELTNEGGFRRTTDGLQCLGVCEAPAPPSELVLADVVDEEEAS